MSNDTFLGNAFNIASYALFTHMIAQVCGFEVDELTWFGGDVHIYNNHREQVNIQLDREFYDLPTLKINPDVKSIFDFKMADFELVNYQSHDTIKADMAV